MVNTNNLVVVYENNANHALGMDKNLEAGLFWFRRKLHENQTYRIYQQAGKAA